MKTRAGLFISAAILLSGCSSAILTQSPADRVIKLSAVGYGSVSTYERYAEGQKRLMAMRASKLDAYRAMAEQVYGVRITGNSTVSAMMLQNDNFRAYIDAYVRGARVASITPMADGNYETTIEMDFDEAAFRNYAAQSQHRALPPAITGSRGTVGPGAAYGSAYYYSE